MTAPKILVCDDETHLREMVAEYLKARDFEVIQAQDAQEMRARLKTSEPDLILLDVRMPNEDGLTALRALRSQRQTPVIMLTATSGTIDRVVGLELGADDYLGKPVDLRELEARIKAVLRRKSAPQDTPSPSNLPPLPDDTHFIDMGHCKLDPNGARLFGADHAEIAITAMEFNLLQVFARNPGRIITRDQILDTADDRGMDPFDRSIDLRISRLRRKIEKNPSKPEIIRTVRGLGYIFDG